MRLVSVQGLRSVSLATFVCAVAAACAGATGDDDPLTDNQAAAGCAPGTDGCPDTAGTGTAATTTPTMAGTEEPSMDDTPMMGEPAMDPMMGDPITEPMMGDPMMETEAEPVMEVEEPAEEPMEGEGEMEDPIEDEPMEEPVEDPIQEPEPDDMMTGEEVPMTDYCAAVAEWDPMWLQWEEEVLLLVNEYRAAGANCGTAGDFEPAGPLEMDSALTCAARVHSLDMYTRMFFDHDNPDGDDPFDRMLEAGFEGSSMGENIAQGYGDPQEVMEGWMDSDGHCSNIMNDGYTLIGVGYYPGSTEGRGRDSNYWTQTFGSPPRSGGGGRF